MDTIEEKSRAELHAAIMNIQCIPDDSDIGGINAELAYKQGHRNARHAAAELVVTHRHASPASASTASRAEEPRLPSNIIQAISRYGDARADESGSADALGEAIKAIRAWVATIATPAPIPAPEGEAREPLSEFAIHELARENGDESDLGFIFNKGDWMSVLTFARAIEEAHGIATRQAAGKPEGSAS